MPSILDSEFKTFFILIDLFPLKIICLFLYLFWMISAVILAASLT